MEKIFILLTFFLLGLSGILFGIWKRKASAGFFMYVMLGLLSCYLLRIALAIEALVKILAATN